MTTKLNKLRAAFDELHALEDELETYAREDYKDFCDKIATNLESQGLVWRKVLGPAAFQRWSTRSKS